MGKVLLKSLQILSKFTGGGGKLHVVSSKEDADADADSFPWMFSCKYPRTQSFSLERGAAKSGEDILRSYNSLYIVSDSKTESSRVLVTVPEDEEEKGHLDSLYESKRFLITYEEEDNKVSGKSCFIEEALDLEDYSSKFSSDSSVFSSDSSSGSSDLPPGLVRGLSSKRFFFSPGRSNSILEEAKCIQQEGFSVDSENSSFFSLRREKIDLPFCTEENCSSDSGSGESDESSNHEDDGDGEASDGDSQCESLAESSDIHDRFQCESIAVLKYSPNPYWDFRISMQEMVDAHNLTEWHCLQEMLLCYLRLNKKKTHKLILGAFADLVINIIAKTSTPLLEYDTAEQ